MVTLKSKLTQAVLSYFYLHEGKESYVNELARRLTLDDGNLARKLKSLEEEGLLKSRWQGKERFYSLNPAFPLLEEYRSIVTKTMGLEHHLAVALKGIKGIKKAVLFGSYAKGTMDPLSDIDLLVVGDHRTVELQKAIAGVQKTIDREINVVSMSQSEYKTKKRKNDPFLRSIESKTVKTIL